VSFKEKNIRCNSFHRSLTNVYILLLLIRVNSILPRVTARSKIGKGGAEVIQVIMGWNGTMLRAIVTTVDKELYIVSICLVLICARSVAFPKLSIRFEPIRTTTSVHLIHPTQLVDARVGEITLQE